MNQGESDASSQCGGHPAAGYRPPTITYLGNLADLTQKMVGAADGTTFLGIDLGSV
jgi:hypothetical protein